MEGELGPESLDSRARAECASPESRSRARSLPGAAEGGTRPQGAPPLRQSQRCDARRSLARLHVRQAFGMEPLEEAHRHSKVAPPERCRQRRAGAGNRLALLLTSPL